MFDDDDFDFGAMEAGAAYALFRHGQDRQTQQLIEAILRSRDAGPEPQQPVVQALPPEEWRDAVPVTPVDLALVDMPFDWDDFIGQAPARGRLTAHLDAARIRKARLPHVLIESPSAGMGKTAMARLTAKTLGVQIIELVPPVDPFQLVHAAEQLAYRDILFVSELQDLVHHRRGGVQNLLRMLEERVAFAPDGEELRLAQFTVIGATSRPDELPDRVRDLFKIQLELDPYSLGERARLAVHLAAENRALEYLDDDTAVAIGVRAMRPPEIEAMVIAQRDLSLHLGRNASTEELLSFLGLENG